ncbi:uncharacterized protein LOC109709980 isoform X1 [Ananas comosus]|uniref:Uncharacterized protein LOC109709980 isoform X1 n=1 Tax=Ananas comosus TaxID=4615 RepID=A0A6P5EWU3_ANACO|nr:uncharacterized protein LOC109709980 isoform X1 [Ananas comosus]XP_020087972.1 uncharacterized protein LOC109709980 isoform X1 [Ananas comosus]XP_020087973.1 uncharacterized protein LOC109709980 isoform X1 [Ananas comosus]
MRARNRNPGRVGFPPRRLSPELRASDLRRRRLRRYGSDEPPRRKGEVLLEAGRLAAAYLISKGLLSPIPESEENDGGDRSIGVSSSSAGNDLANAYSESNYSRKRNRGWNSDYGENWNCSRGRRRVEGNGGYTDGKGWYKEKGRKRRTSGWDKRFHVGRYKELDMEEDDNGSKEGNGSERRYALSRRRDFRSVVDSGLNEKNDISTKNQCESMPNGFIAKNYDLPLSQRSPTFERDFCIEPMSSMEYAPQEASDADTNEDTVMRGPSMNSDAWVSGLSKCEDSDSKIVQSVQSIENDPQCDLSDSVRDFDTCKPTIDMREGDKSVEHNRGSDKMKRFDHYFLFDQLPPKKLWRKLETFTFDDGIYEEVDQEKLGGDSLFRKSDTELNIHFEEEKQEQEQEQEQKQKPPVEVRILELNLMGTAEMSKIPDEPVTDHLYTAEKDLLSNFGILDNNQEIPVINLEGVSQEEDYGYNFFQLE